jgi:tRNA U34 5-carboxymethylaminomethyl modifying enzyme MnmG/GidA
MGKDNTVKRTTTIRFMDTIQLTNALRDFGISIRRTRRDTVYKDDKDIIDYSTMRQLKKHDIPITVSYAWYTDMNYSKVDEIKSVFDLNCEIDLWSAAIDIITYNLTPK